MVKIVAGSNEISLHIEIEHYKSPQSLIQRLNCFHNIQNQKDISENKLHYMNGIRKVEITNQQLYEIYLAKKHKLASSTLYYNVPQQQKFITQQNFISTVNEEKQSFETKAQKLVSKYRTSYSYESKMEFRELSRIQRQIHAKMQPKKDWLLYNWLQWAEQNVEHELKNSFKIEVENLYTHQPLKVSKSHSVRELTESLRKELEEDQGQDVSRYNSHSEDPISCFLYSIYRQLALQMGISGDNIDKSLWLLSQWKQSKTEIEITRTVDNFEVISQKSQVSPIITPPFSQEMALNSDESFLFPKKEKTKEERLKQFQHLDQFYEKSNSFMKNQITQQFFEFFGRRYSDSDYRFITQVAKAKLKYQNGTIIRAPKQAKDGILRPFGDDEKVAIVGDWGTGLKDAFDLLEELVVKRGATIILHLGDVYYAGFDSEFNAIINFIDQLRKKVPTKNLRYYAIPGNHDFYTNGGPFFDSLRSYNHSQEDKQKFGFFCLRNATNTWQYIGLNTGASDNGALNAINVLYEGATVESQELQWAKERINEFKGQTVLLTHHQAFSAYEAILGKETKFGWYDNLVNHSLIEQLSEVTPKVSAWFWGHQHRLAFYKPQVYGVPCARMIGNSAFQINNNDYYKLNTSDFNPTIPKLEVGKDRNGYYYHTGAVVTHNKQQMNITYINMTSSYDQPSQLVNSVSESIIKPIHNIVSANKAYRINDISGLSFCIETTDYVWLHYTPTDFIFQKVGDPTYTGPIETDMEIIIKILKKNEYLFLDQSEYVKQQKQRNESNGKFKFQGNSKIIHTGDSLSLVSSSKNKPLGRYYFLEGLKAGLAGYYCLATGKSTEYKSVQIYDPNENNVL